MTWLDLTWGVALCHVFSYTMKIISLRNNVLLSVHCIWYCGNCVKKSGRCMNSIKSYGHFIAKMSRSHVFEIHPWLSRTLWSSHFYSALDWVHSNSLNLSVKSYDLSIEFLTLNVLGVQSGNVVQSKICVSVPSQVKK